MHYMQSVSPMHSPMHHTLTPLVPLILPFSVMSAKQKTHMVKGLMLHSGHIRNKWLKVLVLNLTVRKDTTMASFFFF